MVKMGDGLHILMAKIIQPYQALNKLMSMMKSTQNKNLHIVMVNGGSHLAMYLILTSIHNCLKILLKAIGDTKSVTFLHHFPSFLHIFKVRVLKRLILVLCIIAHVMKFNNINKPHLQNHVILIRILEADLCWLLLIML